MATNRGKDFEAQVRKAFTEVENTSVDRFADPTAGYAGIKNICDYVIYKFPYQYFIECKAIHGNTLNFNSHITGNQWMGLLEKSKLRGVIAGVLVWFIDHDLTFFVPIQELEMLRRADIRSLNIKAFMEVPSAFNYFELVGKKKRVFFDYDAEHFLRKTSSWYGYWSESIWKVKQDG